jgi:hypothetical protein
MRKFLLLAFLATLGLGAPAWAATPREQFAQMLDLLQKTPRDDALRENIVRLGAELQPPPAVPEEARRAVVIGNAALEEASGPDDYARATSHYEEAVTLAPWWGAAYLALARAQQLQLDYASAQRSVKLYMLAGPSPDDSRKAQDYLYALQYQQNRADKARSDYDAKFGWLSGQWTVTRKLLKRRLLDEGLVDESDISLLTETDPVPVRLTPERSRVSLTVAADTIEHDHRFGADRDNPTRFEDSFHVSYDASGQLVVEVFANRDPFRCTVDYGWNPAPFELSADRRTMTITRDYVIAQPDCQPSKQPSKYLTVWVLQRQ